MTIKEYADEVRLRLERQSVALALDEPTVALLVNRARRDVQNACLSSHPERFGRVQVVDGAAFIPRAEMSVTNPASSRLINVYELPLPQDFIDPVVAILQYIHAGVTYRWEARRADKRELHAVLMQSWNLPTITQPIYVVEREPNDPTPKAFVAGLETGGGTLFSDAAFTDVKFEFWYTAALNHLELFPNPPSTVSDDESRIPWQFEELVIWTAMTDALQKIEAPKALASVRAEIESLRDLLKVDYVEDKLKAGRLLPSREPTPGSAA